MIRTLLATTALTAMLATGALAQTAPATQPDTTINNTVDSVQNAADQAAQAVKDAAQATGEAAKDAAQNAGQAADNAGAAMNNAAENAKTAVHNATARQPWDIAAGYARVDTDNLGAHLIGAPVYSSTADDAEEIGKVTDIVFTHDGAISAAIIGVGGFLGIGEKSVAVDFLSLQWTVAADNTERWVLPTTADALTSAPDFVWVDDAPGAMTTTTTSN
jgi:hypothetical protein